MRITKSEIHEDLRPSVGKLRIYNFFLAHKWGFRFLHFLTRRNLGKITPGLENAERYIPSTHGGPDIRLRIYRPLNITEKLPVVLYLHGGGFALASPERSDRVYKKFTDTRPCILVVPDYRKSIKNPYPAGFNDCYDTLLWVNKNSAELKAIPDKIVVAGHSAGGGLTAAVTLRAVREKSVKIAFQMPIYPMIDDKQQNRSSQFMSPVWDAKANELAWGFYLKDILKDGGQVPTNAAPARNRDYTDFPPTISLVGDLEPFYDETVAYVEQLKKFKIPVEFKVFKGCFHGFDLLAKSKISTEALKFTFDSFGEFYDRYI